MKIDDIDLLRRYLGGVPMTVDQREAVNGQLDRLRGQFADMHMRQRREHAERQAEQAIESITETIGIHNYHEAARHVLETWKAACKIREAHHADKDTIAGHTGEVAPAVAAVAIRNCETIRQLHAIFRTTTAEQLVETAKGIRTEALDGSYLLGVKHKWSAWPSEKLEARAQRAVIDTLRGLLGGMSKVRGCDTPFTDALEETVAVLEHMLDEIPF
jgi:hypothetical protein